MKTEKSYTKWLVAAGCFLMIFLGLGFCVSNKSLYLGAITQALNIERSLFSLQDTLRYTVMVVANIFFGSLLSKFGARKMVLVGFLCYSVYLGISVFAESLAWFYVAGVVFGFGQSFASTAMVSYLVNLWFPEKRGTVSGVILCANGLGSAISAQIISPLISADTFGYRKAYGLALIICVAVGVLVTILITEPKGADRTVAKKKPKGKQWAGISFREAVKKPYFYMALIGVFLTGVSLQGIHGIAATHMKDTGMDPGYVATVLSVAALVLTSSKFVAGFGYDKFGLRSVMAFCEICGCGAFVSLAFCGNTGLGKGLAIAYAVLSSLAMPLETVIVPLIAADLFGEKDFSKLLGIFVAVNYAGYGVGGFVCNLVFDLAGSYVPVLLAMGVVMLAIAVAFQFVINAANKVHDQVVAQ